MRVLIDECLPRRVRRLLPDHECRTVSEMGWRGRKNGDLLALAEGEFDVLLTVDKGIVFQQSIRGRSIAILVLSARANRMAELTPLAPGILDALGRIRPGTVVVVPAL